MASRTAPPTPACPHAALAADFRPFEVADPFPFLARARAETPIFYSPELDYWVVTRYAEARAIFRDPETFSSENTQTPYKERPRPVQRVLDEGGFTGFSGLSGRQPPDHTRIKAFVNKAFTPKRVAVLEPDVRALTVSTIDALVPRGRADLIADLAYDLPALVIFILLGIPDRDVPSVKEWAQSRVYLNFGDLAVDEQVHHAENLVRYWNYCQDLVEARAVEPKDDLPGALVRIYEEGDRSITKHEIASLVYGMLTAGHETTTSLLGNGFLVLLSNLDQWEAICADPSLIPGAVEELLRVGPPVFAWKRKVKKPARIGDIDLPEGANVLLLLGSANRDERVFEDPERVDVRRPNAGDHLAFGQGIHFCLGAALARLEGRVVLEELTARLPHARLSEGQTFTFPPNTTFRCPTSVRVEWDVAKNPVPVAA
jgi:cytochrome P450